MERLLLILCLLYPPPLAAFSNRCARLLADQPFLGAFPWAMRLSQRLAGPQLQDLERMGWRWNSQRALNSIAKEFVYRNGRRTPVLASIEIYSDPKVNSPHVMILMTFFRKEKPNPIGEGAFLVRVNARGELEAELDSFYIDADAPEIEGVSKGARDFIEEKFYVPLRVKRETVFADYIGRYVWAKAGYQFNSSTYFWPEKYKKQGSSIKQPEMIQRNFERYLELHSIELSDLIIRRPGHPNRRITRLEDLREPADFAYVFHARERMVPVAPLIGEGKLARVTRLPVGKAFMLSDYRPSGVQPTIFSKMGTRFSGLAMPKWRGVRELGGPE